MKKILSFSSILFVITFAFVSCSKESATTNDEKGYKINIHATNGAGTKVVTDDGSKGVTTFASTEKIYVCNQNSGNKIDKTAISPTPESDAHNAKIVGTLSGETSGGAAISYANGNSLRLLYNTPEDGIVNYDNQDGTITNVVSAASSDVTISNVTAGKEITTSEADFTNLQSIFKFRFRISASPDTFLGNKVRFVRVFSTRNMLQVQYNAVTGAVTRGPITMSRTTNLTSDYTYIGMRFDPKLSDDPLDELVFQVVDVDGKVYSGSKIAPDGGFANGNFYTATVDVKLYTFTVASGSKVCFSPGDLGAEVVNEQYVYSFTEPFTTWGHGNTTNYNSATDAKAVGKRVWFDFYFESGLENGTVYGITNWRIPKKVSSDVASYEWNYLVNSRTMNSSVARFYKVTIPGHQYCLLLPPDETKSSDIGSDLTSGTVTDYVKYLGKGFVLLFNTNRGMYGSSSWNWGTSSSSYAKQGWYWAVNDGSNRYYFTWPDEGPKVDWGMNRMRNHIRYVHNVTL